MTDEVRKAAEAVVNNGTPVSTRKYGPDTTYLISIKFIDALRKALDAPQEPDWRGMAKELYEQLLSFKKPGDKLCGSCPRCLTVAKYSEMEKIK